MKNFAWMGLVLCALLALSGCTSPHEGYRIEEGVLVFDTPPREPGQQSVLGLAVEPIPVVRVGFIGLGMRGPGAVERFTHLDSVRIVALCDLYPERVASAQEILVRRGLPDLLKMSKDIPGIEQVTLTTNGILLKDKINELISNGLDAVNISIDTLDRDRYAYITRGGDLGEALSGLETALSFPFLKVKINCVPTQDMPEKDYISLARLARDQELDIRFIEMMPIGLGKEFGIVSGDWVYSILKKEFGKAVECIGRFGNGPAVLALKSWLGHTSAACGALELACVLACREAGYMPPIRDAVSFLRSDVRFVRTAAPFPGPVGLVESFGFGGQNAALVLRLGAPKE